MIRSSAGSFVLRYTCIYVSINNSQRLNISTSSIYMNHVIFKASVLSHSNRCPGREQISQNEVFNLFSDRLPANSRCHFPLKGGIVSYSVLNKNIMARLLLAAALIIRLQTGRRWRRHLLTSPRDLASWRSPMLIRKVAPFIAGGNVLHVEITLLFQGNARAETLSGRQNAASSENNDFLADIFTVKCYFRYKHTSLNWDLQLKAVIRILIELNWIIYCS